MNRDQLSVNRERPVRADLIDYRDTGNKGHPFLEIDTYPTLEKAVEDFTSTGWEEDADVLMQNCYFMADGETDQILAVGTYIKTGRSTMPALMWIFTRTGDTAIRYYEKEYRISDQLPVNKDQKGGADD